VKVGRITPAAIVCFLFVTLGAAPSGLAQAAKDKPSTQGAGNKSEATEQYRAGVGNRSMFSDVLGGHWSIVSSLQFMQTYDDNVFLSNSFRKADTVSKYSGRLTLAFRGKHTRFEANYLPEYNMNQRYGPLSYAAHNYNQTFTYQAGPRTEVHWNFSGSYSPGRGGLPFRYLDFGGYQFPVFSLEAIEPSTNILNGNTSLGVSHNFSARSRFTVDLSSATTKFLDRKSTGLPTVSQGQNYSGEINLDWSYDLNPGRSVGFNLANTYSGILQPNTHQHTQSVQATFRQKLPASFNLTVAAGPSFTERQNKNEVDIGEVYSASLSREGKKFGFNVGAAKTFQAGLQFQSLSSDTFSFNVHRGFGRRWTSTMGGAYSRSQDQTGASASENVYGTAQVRYQFTSQLSAFMNYGYTHQGQLSTSAIGIRNVDRNSVAIGLAYDIGVIARR